MDRADDVGMDDAGQAADFLDDIDLYEGKI